MEMEMKFAELDAFRTSLDESEKELFDMLMAYGRELLVNVEQKGLAGAAAR
jgi:hypothetical protein